MFDDPLIAATTKLIAACTEQRLTLATAESCTGGLIAGVLTEIPGSSAVIGRSYVTYANDAKHAMLGVPSATLKHHGAVSEEVVRAMALGAAAVSGADVTIAGSGIAGPGGGTADKPVGTVHMASYRDAKTAHHLAQFGDIGRRNVRLETLRVAISMLQDRL